MTSDGSPWRPLVHAADICQAIACVLEAPREAVHGEIFNVGETTQNYRVREVAELVAEAIPGCDVTFGTQGADNRSYRVSFEKIHRHLPSFSCQWDARRGARGSPWPWGCRRCWGCWPVRSRSPAVRPPDLRLRRCSNRPA